MRGIGSTSTDLRALAATGGALCAVLLLAGVRPTTAVAATALTLAQAWSGRRIAARLVAPAEPGLGVGFAFGALATVVVHVALVATPAAPVAWVLPLVVGAALRRPATTRTADPFEPAVYLAVAGGALVALSGEWFWAFPSGVVLVGWTLARERVAPRVTRRAALDAAAVALAAIVGLAMAMRRPDVWWIFSVDTHYYETLSRSLARDGIADNSLASGFSIAYHWFSFAWVGILDAVTGAPDWVALTRIGPVVAAWFTLAAVAEIPRAGTAARRWLPLGIAAFAASSAFSDWSLPVMLSMSAAFSQLFVGVWLAAFVWLVVRTTEAQVRRPAIAFATLTVALVGGKATHAAVCAAGLVAVAVRDCVRRRSSRSRWWGPAGAAVGVFLLASRLLIGSANDITLAPGRVVLYVSTEYEQFSPMVRLGIACVLLVGMCAFPLVPWLLGASRDDPATTAFLAGAIVAAAGVTLFVVDVSVSDPRGINPNGIYFLHAATTLVGAWWAVAGPAGLAARTPTGGHGLRGRSAVAVGVAAALVPFAMPNPDSGAIGAIGLRLARSPAPLVVVLVAGAFHAVRTRTDPRRWIAAALVASSVAFFVVNWADSMRRDERDMRADGATRLGAASLREAAAWLRGASARDARFASNFFVESPRPADLAWIDPAVDWTRRTPSLAFASGNSPLLVAWSDRGALLQAPALVGAYQRFAGDRETEISRRISLSVAFADAPDAGTSAALRDYGVSWFVVDLRRTATRDWSPWAVVRHANEDFAVLELTRDATTTEG
jgi:hypothetical protein